MQPRFRLTLALAVPLALLIALLAIADPAPMTSARPLSIVAQAMVERSESSPTESIPTDAGFGPALFLVPVPDDQTLSALPPTLILHTPLDAEHTLFIASGGPADLRSMQDAGIDAILLDAQTAGRRYYLVDAQPDQVRSEDLAGGEIRYDAGATLLIGTSQANERTMVETLTNRSIRISLVTADPFRFADAEIVSAASFEQIGEADPLIAGLLSQLNTADLAKIIGELSGETAAAIGDSTVIIDTRYTFSSRIDESEQYIFHAYEQMGIAAHYANWTYGSYSGRNVVAELKGVLHPERVWLIGGHFDSNSEIPYSRAPGADDNASGSASTLLIAAILNQVDLADTVRFVHFSGEEQGQWGSKHYVPTLAGNGEQIMGFFDLDMIGWDGNGDGVAELHTGTGEASNLLGTAMIDAGAAYSLGLSFERKTTSASRFSDHSPFWDGGYPAILAIENFFVDTIPADRSPWYHNSGDTLDHVDLDYVLAYARTALATIAELSGAAETIDPPAPTPTPEPATATPTTTPGPSGCVDLVINGGWEETGGWRYGTTPFSARVVSTPVHAGEHALQQGIPTSAADRTAHSSAFQEVTIPADAESIELRYWARPGGNGDGVNFREVRLLTPGYGNLAQIDRDTTTGDNQWHEKVFDLSAYRGQTVILYFNVYNDGNNSQLWTYVDDVALLACSEILPSDTSTPTSTPALTPTSTPIVTPTATMPITATITPTATVVPTGTPSPGPVTVSPASIDLDLRQGESKAAITFDDGDVAQLWQAESSANWISLSQKQGRTDETLQVVVVLAALPGPGLTGEMTPTTALTATSSISITFPAISDTAHVGITVTYGPLEHAFIPAVSGVD